MHLTVEETEALTIAASNTDDERLRTVLNRILNGRTRYNYPSGYYIGSPSCRTVYEQSTSFSNCLFSLCNDLKLYTYPPKRAFF